MKATGEDVTMAWIVVAFGALERAAEAANSLEGEALARYEAERDRAEQIIREAMFWLRLRHVVELALERERAVAA